MSDYVDTRALIEGLDVNELPELPAMRARFDEDFDLDFTRLRANVRRTATHTSRALRPWDTGEVN